MLPTLRLTVCTTCESVPSKSIFIVVMFATTQVSGSFENALKPLAAITLASPVVTQVSQPRATLRCQQPKLFVAVTSANVIPSITPVRTASAMSEVPAISEILTSKTATQPKKKSKSKKAKTAARKVKASRGRGVTVPAATRQRVVLLPVALRPVAVRQAGPKSNGASTTYSFQGPNGKQTVTVRTAVARSKTTYLTRVTTPLKAALATHALNSQTSRASNQDIEVLGVATPTKRATKRSTMPTVEDTFADGTVSEKSAPIAMPELTELPATPQKTNESELPATPQKTDVSELPATPQQTEKGSYTKLTLPTN